MKTAILTLDPHDDLISIRDKLAWAKSPRIVLVWPRRRRRNVEAPLVLSRLDLTLLARHARGLGAQLALVTSNAQVRAYADEAGVPVFHSTEEAQESAWRRVRRRNWRLGRERRVSVLAVDQPGLAAGVAVARRNLRAERAGVAQAPEPVWKKNKYLRIAVFTIGVLAVLALLALYLPSAHIRLALEKQPRQVRLEVWASLDVQQAQVTGGMPARTVTVVVEGQQQAFSSGQVWLAEDYAAGQVLLTNLGESSLTLPAGSVLRTLVEPPQRFELTGAVELPPGNGQTAQASVRALQAGVEGNVPAHAIQSLEGSAGAQVAVDNPDPLTGGSRRLAPAPTEADYKKAREQLLESLRQQALEELNSKLGEGDRLISTSLQLTEIQLEESSPAKGSAADVLLLTMRAEYSVWVVRQEDLARVARMALQATLPKGFEGDAASLEYHLESDFTPQSERQAAVLSASWQISSSYTPWQVVQALLGKTPGEASETLQSILVLSQPPAIELSPTWWPALPLLPGQIQIEEVQL